MYNFLTNWKGLLLLFFSFVRSGIHKEASQSAKENCNHLLPGVNIRFTKDFWTKALLPKALK